MNGDDADDEMMILGRLEELLEALQDELRAIECTNATLRGRIAKLEATVRGLNEST